MSALVFIELDEGNVKKSSLEAVSYAHAVEGEVTALLFGTLADAEVLRIAAQI